VGTEARLLSIVIVYGCFCAMMMELSSCDRSDKQQSHNPYFTEKVFDPCSGMPPCFHSPWAVTGDTLFSLKSVYSLLGVVFTPRVLHSQTQVQCCIGDFRCRKKVLDLTFLI
jgi:hypothetical protein